MKEGDSNKASSGDSDVPKSPPLSGQDLNSSGASQDIMPVSSTAFSWTAGDSSHSIISSSRGVDSSSGSAGLHASLADWTHFESSINTSDHDTHSILKELMKDEPDVDNSGNDAHAILKRLLNEKSPGASEDTSNQLRKLLGDISAVPNGSPTAPHQDQSICPPLFMQNHPEQPSTLPIGKRKIEEIDGADPGNAPKLAEKNKMLAALLQNTPRQNPEVLPTVLPAPNPGDLPQNKLPKDLTTRILQPPGQQRQPQMKASMLPNTNPLAEFFIDPDFTRPSNNISNMDNYDSIFDLFEDFSDLGDNLSGTGVNLSATDKNAIEQIKDAMLKDFRNPNGQPSPLLQPDTGPFMDPPNMQPVPMGPRYSMVPNQMIRGPMHNFPTNNDLMFQRMPSGGPHLMLPNQVSPPSRPGGLPSDFTASRSPAPPSVRGTATSQQVKDHLRMHTWSRSQARQQMGGMGPQTPSGMGAMTMGINPAAANPQQTLQRSLSIPSPGTHAFPVNGFQNVPQNGPQFPNQQSVPYSPPPQAGGLRFPVQNPPQPLSPRHPVNAQGSGRMMRPNMWAMQNPQLSGLSPAGGAPQSPHPLGNPGNPMGQVGNPQQQSPSPYANQQFNNGQMFTIPQQTMQQQPGQPVRFPTQGGAGMGPQGAGAPQFAPQGQMMAQQDAYGGGNGFYPRGMAPGMQQRMGNPGQNQQMMRQFVNTLPDDMRQNDGSFGNFQLNGTINSAPPNLNTQQSQFRWDIDRSNMSLPSTPGLSNQSNTRLSAPNLSGLDAGFQQFESYYSDEPSNINNGQSHMMQSQQQQQQQSDQQFRNIYSNEQQHSLLPTHMNQQAFVPSSSGDLMGINHPNSSPVHHVQSGGDRSTSLLQKLLSENSQS